MTTEPITFATRPETCPACGAAYERTDAYQFTRWHYYECGMVAYVEGSKEWQPVEGVEDKRCRNAFTAAVQLRAELAHMSAYADNAAMQFATELRDNAALRQAAAQSGEVCPKCGQSDHGQYGEYPCSVCGLPNVWDDVPEPRP